jgi:hypothetical protein
MTQNRVSPPPAPACLDRPVPTSQKGGTLIATGVLDRATHEALLASPDGYRPVACPHCQHERLHVHDYPQRVVRGDDGAPSVRVIRHRCARCGATWRTLPEFICIQLPRSWPVVEAAVSETPSRGQKIPARTRRRWTRRLLTAARVAIAALAASGDVRLEGLAARTGLDATRRQLIGAFEATFSTVAATLWRLVPGLRVM